MKVKIYDTHGKTHGDADLKIQSSGASFQLIQDAVVTHRANQRQGNASTKTRGEVSGGGKKPWRQKGTGRARAGSIRSPLWRHGGVVFGPKPRDYGKTMPKQMKRAAFQNALVQRAEAGDLIVLKGLKLSSPKTREFAAVVEKLPLDGGTALLVYGEPDKNLILAGRNLPRLDLVSAESLNIYQVLMFGKLIFTEDALDKVRDRLGEKKESKKKGEDK
jgi:large subunit ribosomal protein L4